MMEFMSESLFRLITKDEEDDQLYPTLIAADDSRLVRG